MKDKSIINSNCWIAYFDLLGFKNEINRFKDNLGAFAKTQYEDILLQLNRNKKRIKNWSPEEYNYCVFSDSFLLYAANDSMNSYFTVYHAATDFFVESVMRQQRPLRGALTCGKFYADMEKNIFLGPSIIDAYNYVEKQDWIGLVLAPEALSKLERNNNNPFNLAYHFTEYNVPVKLKTAKDGVEVFELKHEKLLAFSFRKDEMRHDVFVNRIKSVS